MKAKTLILPILFVAIAIATYWFYTESTFNANKIGNNNVKQQEATASITTRDSTEESGAQDEQKETTDESLYDLKSSIQGVIADSIQDEIQEAVENKIIKTDNVQQ